MIRFLFIVLIVISLKAEDIYATFDVVANKDASLNISSSGIVSVINVDVGSVVKKGALLLEIDNSDIKANIELSHERLNKATIEEKFAKESYERYKKVSDVIDKELFDNQSLAYQKAQAGTAEAKASLKYQQALLEKTRLRAPFDGVIASKNIELGDYSSPSVALFRLISKHSTKLVLNFDEKYLHKIKVGSSVKYKIGSTEKIAKITKIYPSVNPKNRKATAEAQVGGLTVGSFGEAYITAK